MSSGDRRGVRPVGSWGCVAALVLAVLALLWPGARSAFALPVGQITEFTAGFNADSTPNSITVGPDGDLWWVDLAGTGAPTVAGAPAIGRFDPSTQKVTEFSLPTGTSPESIAAGPDGDLWFTELIGPNEGEFGRIDPSTGTITQFPAGLPAGDAPLEMTAGPDGGLWFTIASDNGNSGLGRLDPSTGKITTFTPSGVFPDEITVGPDGNLWFTDSGGTSGRIGRFDLSTHAFTEFSTGLTAGDEPDRIAAGPDGSVWFTEDGSAGGTVGRIDPSTGAISEFPTPSLDPAGIAAGQDGDLWFTSDGAGGATSAIGRIDPSTGGITTFTAGLRSGSGPGSIAPGPDGNLWFTDNIASGSDGNSPAIGRVGTGAPAAVAGPVLSGSGQAGTPQTCQASFATWAGVRPSLSLFSFDGFRWTVDGVPVAGQTGQTFTPSTADEGHQLGCSVTVSYPLPFSVTARASAAITVSGPGAPGSAPAAPAPAVTGLKVSPKRVSIAGRRVHRRCVAPSKKNRRRPACTRKAKVTIRYTLNVAASVRFELVARLRGHRVRRRCVVQTGKRRKGKRCTRRVAAGKAIVRTGVAGANKLVVSRKLAPGRYTVTVTPTGGRARRVSFKVVG